VIVSTHHWVFLLWLNLLDLLLEAGSLDCHLRAAVRQQSVCMTPGNVASYRPQLLCLTSGSVTFEEYIYYAKIEREREKSLPDVGKRSHSLKTLFEKTTPVTDEPSPPPIVRQNSANKSGSPEGFDAVGDEEWYQAARALRTATWGAVFYLITTDVLGPYSVPYED
jgi:hypothetical protein